MKKIQSKVVAPKPAAVEAAKVVILSRSTKERKGSSIVFTIPGVRGRVLVSRVAFNGEPPATIEVVGQPFALAAAKMTAEERAAVRAAMTPVQKAQAARVRADRAARLAAKLEAAAK